MESNMTDRATKPVKATPILRAVIDERGLKHVWLADRLGISRQHLSNILAGRRSVTVERAERMRELVGVPFFVAFVGADETLLVQQGQSGEAA